MKTKIKIQQHITN